MPSLIDYFPIVLIDIKFIAPLIVLLKSKFNPINYLIL